MNTHGKIKAHVIPISWDVQFCATKHEVVIFMQWTCWVCARIRSGQSAESLSSFCNYSPQLWGTLWSGNSLLFTSGQSLVRSLIYRSLGRFVAQVSLVDTLHSTTSIYASANEQYHTSWPAEHAYHFHFLLSLTLKPSNKTMIILNMMMAMTLAMAIVVMKG